MAISLDAAAWRQATGGIRAGALHKVTRSGKLAIVSRSAAIQRLGAWAVATAIEALLDDRE